MKSKTPLTKKITISYHLIIVVAFLLKDGSLNTAKNVCKIS